MITFILGYVAYSLLAFWILWIFYLAVMNLSRARDAGTLSKSALYLGTPVLVIGLVLDFLINVFIMSLVLFELPKEGTVTSRLKRHFKNSTGWRLTIVKWFKSILDPYDPNGSHI